LGIEAISRGATSALFLDRGKAALAAIGDNIRNLGLQDRTRVMRWNILNNLNCLMSSPQGFDLIFMDPPYGIHAVPPTLAHLLASGALAPGAHLVIEQRAGEGIESRPPFVAVDQRRFGKTLVTFMDAML
jgi:16S rRNA (guanine966-N2)-methyltransferase